MNIPIVIVVLPELAASRAACTTCSLSVSKAEVATIGIIFTKIKNH
jgi:hypothetical protein